VVCNPPYPIFKAPAVFDYEEYAEVGGFGVLNLFIVDGS